jgi:PAS domain S-box-containing protein
LTKFLTIRTGIMVKREKITGLRENLDSLREENNRFREKITALKQSLGERARTDAALRQGYEELRGRLNEGIAELARSRKLLDREMVGRKLIEKNLSDSEEKYRALFSISPEGIMLFDLKGNVITGNERICQLYGYTLDELLELSLQDIVPEELEGNFPRLVENLKKKGDLFFTSQGKKRDGSVFPAELSAGLFPWRGELSVQVLVRDITKRKQIEQALEASENRLRSIIENSADGILIIDKNGTVWFVNPATERLFDRRADEFVGAPFAIPLIGGETAEIVIERPGRQPLTVEVRVSDIRWEGMTAFLASLRDVTARKELEKLKDDFIDTLSHEIRNPLAVLRLGIGQIGDGLSGPGHKQHREILAIALREIDRLSRLVNNLLDLSKIEAGRVSLTRSQFNFNSLIADATAKFQGTAEEKGLQMIVDTPAKPILIYADQDRLHQVLTNLIGNAFKFTPAGEKITIAAAETGGEIECSVSDTGSGIVGRDIKRVFEKFIQCSYPTDGDAQGSGLGLTISKQLVDLHSGQIWAQSQPERGCRFVFRIPDHRSEKSLVAYLDRLLHQAELPRFRLSLLGFRLENSIELRREWGEEIIFSFSRQLFQKLGLLIRTLSRSVPHCWLMEDEDSFNFVAVLSGVGPDEVRMIYEKTLRKLKKLRFHHGAESLEFGLRSAWIAPGRREIDGSGLIDSLKVLLARKGARVPRSRSRGRVLIVDDEPAVVKLLTSFLEREDFETESAFTGEQALTIIGSGQLDLIILDMGLPKMSGYEVINHLRKDHKTFDIPLILISGHGIDQVRLEKSGAGATPILLEKPLDYNQVREAVNRKLAVEDVPV